MQSIPVAEIEIKPLALNETFFSDRIDGISPELSAAIYNVFKQAHMMNDDGTLIENPRYGLNAAMLSGVGQCCLSCC